MTSGFVTRRIAMDHPDRLLALQKLRARAKEDAHTGHQLAVATLVGVEAEQRRLDEAVAEAKVREIQARDQGLNPQRALDGAVYARWTGRLRQESQDARAHADMHEQTDLACARAGVKTASVRLAKAAQDLEAVEKEQARRATLQHRIKERREEDEAADRAVAAWVAVQPLESERKPR